MTAKRMKVHPVAELFPMLGEEDLQQLADSIAENGLLEPIVVDKDDRIIDGRNRLAACKLAKVEPEFVVYAGDEEQLDTYALTVNIARRHMSKGSLAMVAAKAIFLRNKTQVEMAQAWGITQAKISIAGIVQEYAPELVDAVIAGASLNDAYEFAHARKVEAENAAQTEQDRLDQLDKDAEKRQRQVEAEAKRVRQTIEDIGPPVALPSLAPPPKVGPEMPAEVDAGPTVDDLKEVKAYLHSLVGVRDSLKRLADNPPDSGVMTDWLSQGAYSALTQIVVLAAEVSEKCNVNMLDKKTLRSIK